MTETSPLVDIHDPREHFRKLIGDTQASLTDHVRAMGQAMNAFAEDHSEDQHLPMLAEVQKTTQRLALFVATTMTEANRLGIAEGREERDITEVVYRGALHLLSPDYLTLNDGMYGRDGHRAHAIEEARIIWDDTRKAVLAVQATVRAKHEAQAAALVNDFVKTMGKVTDAKPSESP